MALNGPIQFELTLKGSEELSARTYRLDVKLRNILFMIQKGCASFDAILQNSIFPREEVLERLRNLINEKFIALSPAGAAALPAGAAADAGAAPAPGPTAAPAPTAAAGAPAAPALRANTRSGPSTQIASFPQLSPAASLSQARFILSDFCLDAFGLKGQEFADAAQRASRLSALQGVLDDILEQLRRVRPDQVAVLAARVGEINETGV